jgi:hypothetical protein
MYAYRAEPWSSPYDDRDIMKRKFEELHVVTENGTSDIAPISGLTSLIMSLAIHNVVVSIVTVFALPLWGIVCRLMREKNKFINQYSHLV